ncbi:MAG: NAD(P)-binding protein, partial [Chloroflexi bacterium]|nr:NAD(P)-binding protein [Chloroflexota bacterium]
MKIGIIGAGAAGLAAAYEFVRNGHSATVFESAPFVGGQASTIEVGGGRLERGYHHLFTNDTAMIELMGELGIGGSLRWIRSTVGT